MSGALHSSVKDCIMAKLGTIRFWNPERGTGTIDPDHGGDALPFKRADLQDGTEQPAPEQRYSYETYEVNGGGKRAVDLRPLANATQERAQPRAQEQQGTYAQQRQQRDQARNQLN